MASLLAPGGLYRCYYCHFESTENAFKYNDNKKVDQPRHRCQQCHRLFTLGSHGRPQGRTYAKKRNEDPAELKSLSRQCRHCGVADNAIFKYHNNKSRSQPRFQCLSCGEQFQMRLMGTGDEVRLVHTSSNHKHAASHYKKTRVPEAFTNASKCEEEIYQPSDGSFMPVPFDPLMTLESGVRLLPENCAPEDVQYASFLETALTDDESVNADLASCNANVDSELLPELNTEEAELAALFDLETFTDQNERADPLICTFNGDDGLPLGLSGAKNAEFLASLETGFLTDGNEAPWNVDTANVNDGLPLWRDNDAALMDFEFAEAGARVDESHDTEIVSENMTNVDSNYTSSAEVASDTLLAETLAPTEFDSWSDGPTEDPSSTNYLEAAVACCNFMDTAHSMAVAPVQLEESSSSSTSKPYSFQHDLMEEDDQCSVSDWNKWQEEEDDM